MTASSTRSRNSTWSGKSLARKKGPLDVPPRMSMHGMRVCDGPANAISSYKYLRPSSATFARKP